MRANMPTSQSPQRCYKDRLHPLSGKGPCDAIRTPGIGCSITPFPQFLDRLGMENRVHFLLRLMIDCSAMKPPPDMPRNGRSAKAAPFPTSNVAILLAAATFAVTIIAPLRSMGQVADAAAAA